MKKIIGNTILPLITGISLIIVIFCVFCIFISYTYNIEWTVIFAKISLIASFIVIICIVIARLFFRK